MAGESPTRFEGGVYVNGPLSARSMSIPAASVVDASVAALAGISASKLQHQHVLPTQHCNHATSLAVDRRQAHRVYGATAEILKFGVVASVATGATTTIVVDLKKNGSSILSATISLTSTTAAFVLLEPAGFTSVDLVVGDVLESDIVSVTGANPPKGVTTYLYLVEDAS